jgi:hypothetical protein
MGLQKGKNARLRGIVSGPYFHEGNPVQFLCVTKYYEAGAGSTVGYQLFESASRQTYLLF